MSQPSATLICPKCQSPLRQYERSGIVIDQCTQCGGVFLDRGELEQLMAAEDQHYQNPPQQAGYPAQQPSAGGFLGQILGGGHRGGDYRRGHH